MRIRSDSTSNIATFANNDLFSLVKCLLVANKPL